jgi:hypothetical protein
MGGLADVGSRTTGTVVDWTKDHERRGPGGPLRLGNERAPSFERVMMNFEPYDVATPPCVWGSDLIDYMTTLAELSGEPGAIQWTRSAQVIDPTQSYTTSLEATPDRSVLRWIPPAGSGLATVIFRSQAAETTVLIRYAHGGPSTRCP